MILQFDLSRLPISDICNVFCITEGHCSKLNFEKFKKEGKFWFLHQFYIFLGSIDVLWLFWNQVGTINLLHLKQHSHPRRICCRFHFFLHKRDRSKGFVIKDSVAMIFSCWRNNKNEWNATTYSPHQMPTTRTTSDDDSLHLCLFDRQQQQQRQLFVLATWVQVLLCLLFRLSRVLVATTNPIQPASEAPRVLHSSS